jgi:hypothetical protein
MPEHRMVEIDQLSRAALATMAAHGRAVREAERELAAGGGSILAAALEGVAAVYEWQHYPHDDVYDPASHAQYFYHAHPASERQGLGRDAREHGHFHTFLRSRGMPPGVRPLVMPELAIADNPAAPKSPLMPSAPQNSEGDDADPWSHLVAIAMDATARPLRFFTTNRWVTGETWYPAQDVAAMLGCFTLGAMPPAPALNRWIAGMLGLYRPLLGPLIAARDAKVMEWRRRRRAKVHVLDDRRLEVTSTLEIDVERHINAVAVALARIDSSTPGADATLVLP